jgi:riboflavin kinase/FMN adenylyltransferase
MTVAAGEKFGGSATTAIDGRDVPPPEARGGVVAVGNFDGVHRGHAELLRQARLLAGEVGGPVTVVTFDPHPLQLLAPERFLPPLTTTADRARFLHEAGADAVVFLRTNADLLALTPEEFFQSVLRNGFAARGVVEGFNFRFGHDRAGSVETLRDLCAAAGVAFRVVAPFALDGVTVSSSKVRDALLAGDVTVAAKLLGRPYLLRGVVGTGAKRGRTIGFPTANLEAVETLVPATGVYAVRADAGGRRYPAAANVGPNPTFGEDARKIEAHLIGFADDLYGRPLAVEFAERLRDTRKFNSAEELVAQMRADVARALALLGGAP